MKGKLRGSWRYGRIVGKKGRKKTTKDFEGVGRTFCKRGKGLRKGRRGSFLAVASLRYEFEGKGGE